MQVAGLFNGSRFLGHVRFPTTEVQGPDVDEDEIQGLIDQNGLICRARDLKTTLAEKERFTSPCTCMALPMPRPMA